MGVPTIIVARTDADADLITSDIVLLIKHLLQENTRRFYRTNAGLDRAIARGLAYAPYADLVWCETSEPNLEDAKRFADAIHKSIQGSYLHITAHLHSTGNKTR